MVSVCRQVRKEVSRQFHYCRSVEKMVGSKWERLIVVGRKIIWYVGRFSYLRQVGRSVGSVFMVGNYGRFSCGRQVGREVSLIMVARQLGKTMVGRYASRKEGKKINYGKYLCRQIDKQVGQFWQVGRFIHRRSLGKQVYIVGSLIIVGQSEGWKV